MSLTAFQKSKLVGTAVEANVATGVVAAAVLTANANRAGGMIMNLDATIVIKISLSDPTVATSFFNLPAGATFSLAGYQGPVYAKAASGTPTLYVQQLVG